MLNPSYIGSREDVEALIPRDARKILDIGCSIGTLGENLKRRNLAEVIGIEIDHEMGAIAEKRLDRVVIGDIEQLELGAHFQPDYFDCIIFADILEHLKNPWRILKESVKYLNAEGSVILSIPNIRHYRTFLNLLLRGYWPYEERGIHDRGHLRFFALKNIMELLEMAGLQIIRLERSYRIVETPSSINRFSKAFLFLLPKDFITYQFLIRAEKRTIKQGKGVISPSTSL